MTPLPCGESVGAQISRLNIRFQSFDTCSLIPSLSLCEILLLTNAFLVPIIHMATSSRLLPKVAAKITCLDVQHT